MWKIEGKQGCDNIGIKSIDEILYFCGNPDSKLSQSIRFQVKMSNGYFSKKNILIYL